MNDNPRAGGRDAVTLGTTDTMSDTSLGPLAHLRDLDDYEVADGEPDVRGWSVRGADGRRVGEVADLLVDTGAMTVRYIEVELDEDVAEENARARGTADPRTEPTRHVLVPVGAARLDEARDDVVLLAEGARIAGLPAYGRGALTREYEVGLLRNFRTARQVDTSDAARRGEFYAGPQFDDRAFFGRRRRGGDGATYITRSEEELRVGTRAVEAGAVVARKRVETERVRESVLVRREEVTVERRPVSADAAARGDATIGDDEIRVPLMAEEVVAEKRVVPREEVVIRKRAVTDHETVEADVRKERVDVEPPTDAPGAREAGRDRR